MHNLDFQFSNVPHSKPIKSFVLQRVSQWLKNHKIELDRTEEPFEGRVLLHRDPASKGVQCEIEFRSGRTTWRNMAVEKGLNGAVDKCLKHLNRVNHAQHFFFANTQSGSDLRPTG